MPASMTTCWSWPRPRRRRPLRPAPTVARPSIPRLSASTASPGAPATAPISRSSSTSSPSNFAKASDEADVKDTARCNALPTEMKERPNYVQQLTLEETYMKARVERIEAVKPSLVALYDTLSPEQKTVLDRPRPMMMGGMHRRHGGGPR
jgi:hypothetical protein